MKQKDEKRPASVRGAQPVVFEIDLFEDNVREIHEKEPGSPEAPLMCTGVRIDGVLGTVLVEVAMREGISPADVVARALGDYLAPMNIQFSRLPRRGDFVAPEYSRFCQKILSGGCL